MANMLFRGLPRKIGEKRKRRAQRKINKIRAKGHTLRPTSFL